ncbi:MAG: Holliday junction resolvase RuvX [Patescibacteria group bacterium]|jgi:putative Holliday junction resolvase
MRYLGVDFGLKKIGLALGDDETNLAFPMGNIEGGTSSIASILARAKFEGAEAFVVGLPIPDAHQTEEQLEMTKQFARDLGTASSMPIYVVDEQFSSAEARRLQIEYGNDMAEDALAATIILQAFLDGDRDLTIETAKRREE